MEKTSPERPNYSHNAFKMYHMWDLSYDNSQWTGANILRPRQNGRWFEGGILDVFS